jgi:hypothetical protein
MSAKRISAWATRHRVRKIFKEFAGREERFCYLSSEAGECFQIAIQPPTGDRITIDASSIDTLDDRDLHQSWTVTPATLAETLESAMSVVRAWMQTRAEITLLWGRRM